MDAKLMEILVYEVSNRIPNIKKYKLWPRIVTFFVAIQFIGGDINSFLYKVHKERCTKCGLCVKQCPTKNIYMNKRGEVKFHHNCLMCMRCSLYCPTSAIDIGFLQGWKVNGRYNFAKIAQIENKEPVITELGLEDTVYETKNGFGPKSKCRDILLLHNIQTVIAQNNELKNGGQYSQGVFYKFPFHLYKKESWDIEHIDSSTENPLENVKDQKEWIKYSMIGLPNEEKEKKEILSAATEFLKKKKNEIKQEDFDKLRTKIIGFLPVNILCTYAW